MSRSLPLNTPDATTVSSADPNGRAPAATATPALTGTVAVYDPAMCCPTGVCGPGVDPALLQLARDLRWLAAQGVTVERFGLSQEPQAFVANPRIAGLLQAFGDGALPAVLANGAVLAHGRYPSRDELVAALGAAVSAPETPSKTAPAAARPAGRRAITILGDADGGSSCEPGSGCC